MAPVTRRTAEAELLKQEDVPAPVQVMDTPPTSQSQRQSKTKRSREEEEEDGAAKRVEMALKKKAETAWSNYQYVGHRRGDVAAKKKKHEAQVERLQALLQAERDKVAGCAKELDEMEAAVAETVTRAQQAHEKVDAFHAARATYMSFLKEHGGMS